MARRKKFDEGNVIEIRLEDGSLAYGIVVKEPLIAFSSATFTERPEISPELFKEIAFQLWVMSSAIGKHGWPVVGNIQVGELNLDKPVFYRHDSISKKFFHYVDCVNDKPSSKENCIGLECAAVWSKGHIEDRLFSTKKGSTCKWENSLKAENRV